jgi:hypothetical protein
MVTVKGSLAIVALSLVSLPGLARQPESGDVVLTIGCPVSPCRFQQGEVIRLKLNFTAAVAGYGMRDGVQVGDGLSLRQSGMDWLTTAPGDCVSDPLAGSMIQGNGSGISGMPPLMPGKPRSVPVELNQWIRFGCPGKYQLTAQSSRPFWGANGAPQLHRQVTLVSDPIEIEIVPADAQWQKEQLARILAGLSVAGDPAFARATIRALSYLGSDAALLEIRKYVSLEPSSSRNNSYVLEWEMARLELLRHQAPAARR